MKISEITPSKLKKGLHAIFNEDGAIVTTVKLQDPTPGLPYSHFLMDRGHVTIDSFIKLAQKEYPNCILIHQENITYIY